MKYQDMVDARAKLVADMRALLDKAETDGKRELTAEESEQYDKMDADFATLDKQITEENEKRSAAAERVKKLSEREDMLEQPMTDPLKPEVEKRENPKQEEKRVGLASPEYRDVFMANISGSMTTAQRQKLEEYRALQVDIDTSGGFLAAPEEFRGILIKKLDNLVFFRQFANVFSIQGQGSLSPALDNDPGTYSLAWTAEIKTGAEDSTMDFDARRMTPYPLARRIKISNTLLRVSSMDVQSLVADRLAHVFGIVEEYNFLQGDGSMKPLGVLTASAAGVNTGQDTTAASTTVITSDELYDVVYTLKAQYRKNARWILGRTGVKNVMKLKTGEGDYIWKPGIREGQPNSLCGYPIHESEYMPAFSTGNYVAVFGDFSFYWICERLNFQVKVLNELYAETNQTGLIARREVDGMPVVEEAFARIALA